jgi:hypothetical protein
MITAVPAHRICQIVRLGTFDGIDGWALAGASAGKVNSLIRSSLYMLVSLEATGFRADLVVATLSFRGWRFRLLQLLTAESLLEVLMPRDNF